VEELCPRAWLINYINPTACFGIMLMRGAPGVRSFALCDGLHEPHFRRRLLRAAGRLGEDEENPALEAATEIRLGGVNHFTWMWGLTVGGEDCLPAYYDYMRARAGDEDDKLSSKGRKNGRYRLALSEIFGAAAMCIGHTKEYVPYWQGYSANPPDIEPIIPFDAPERARQRAEIYAGIDDYVAGGRSMEEFFREIRADHATDVIESMWGSLGKRFYINQPNRGAVSNMDDDAFLELLSDVDLDGPRPVPVGEMPRGIKGLTQQVLDTHELTVEAAMSCDRELLAAEREALPAEWFAPALEAARV